MEKRKISIEIDKEVYDMLKKFSGENRLSMTWIINYLVRHFLKDLKIKA